MSTAEVVEAPDAIPKITGEPENHDTVFLKSNSSLPSDDGVIQHAKSLEAEPNGDSEHVASEVATSNGIQKEVEDVDSEIKKTNGIVREEDQGDHAIPKVLEALDADKGPEPSEMIAAEDTVSAQEEAAPAPSGQVETVINDTPAATDGESPASSDVLEQEVAAEDTIEPAEVEKHSEDANADVLPVEGDAHDSIPETVETSPVSTDALKEDASVAPSEALAIEEIPAHASLPEPEMAPAQGEDGTLQTAEVATEQAMPEETVAEAEEIPVESSIPEQFNGPTPTVEDAAPSDAPVSESAQAEAPAAPSENEASASIDAAEHNEPEVENTDASLTENAGQEEEIAKEEPALAVETTQSESTEEEPQPPAQEVTSVSELSEPAEPEHGVMDTKEEEEDEAPKEEPIVAETKELELDAKEEEILTEEPAPVVETVGPESDAKEEEILTEEPAPVVETVEPESDAKEEEEVPEEEPVLVETKEPETTGGTEAQPEEDAVPQPEEPASSDVPVPQPTPVDTDVDEGPAFVAPTDPTIEAVDETLVENSGTTAEEGQEEPALVTETDEPESTVVEREEEEEPPVPDVAAQSSISNSEEAVEPPSTQEDDAVASHDVEPHTETESIEDAVEQTASEDIAPNATLAEPTSTEPAEDAASHVSGEEIQVEGELIGESSVIVEDAKQEPVTLDDSIAETTEGVEHGQASEVVDVVADELSVEPEVESVEPNAFSQVPTEDTSLQASEEDSSAVEPAAEQVSEPLIENEEVPVEEAANSIVEDAANAPTSEEVANARPEAAAEEAITEQEPVTLEQKSVEESSIDGPDSAEPTPMETIEEPGVETLDDVVPEKVEEAYVEPTQDDEQTVSAAAPVSDGVDEESLESESTETRVADSEPTVYSEPLRDPSPGPQEDSISLPEVPVVEAPIIPPASPPTASIDVAGSEEQYATQAPDIDQTPEDHLPAAPESVVLSGETPGPQLALSFNNEEKAPSPEDTAAQAEAEGTDQAVEDSSTVVQPDAQEAEGTDQAIEDSSAVVQPDAQEAEGTDQAVEDFSTVVQPDAQETPEAPQESAEPVNLPLPAPVEEVLASEPVEETTMPALDQDEVIPEEEKQGLSVNTADIERPKSPWTPSYSVTSQGPGVVAEEEIPEIEQLSPAEEKATTEPQSEELPEAQLPVVNVVTEESEPSVAESTEVDHPSRPSSPWVPSYSVSVQGSPSVSAHASPVSPSVDLPKESTEVGLDSALAEFDNAPVNDQSDVAPNGLDEPEVDAPSLSDQATVETDQPDVVAEAPEAEPAQAQSSLASSALAENEADTPSVSDETTIEESETVQPDVIAEAPAEELTESVATPAAQESKSAVPSHSDEPTSEPANDSQPSELSKESEPEIEHFEPHGVAQSSEPEAQTDFKVVEEETPAAELPQSTAIADPSDKVEAENVDQPDILSPPESGVGIERPKSPWGSYEVMNQHGRMEELEQAVDEEEEEEEPRSFIAEEPAAQATDDSVQEDKPTENEDAVDAAKLTVETAGTDLPERPKSPWTPSYSVMRQGSGVFEESKDEAELAGLEPLEPRTEQSTAGENAAVPSAEPAEIPAPVEPVVQVTAAEEDAGVDDEAPAVSASSEAFPSSTEPELEGSERSLTSLDTVGDTLTVAHDRKRLESTASSLFFPGGWFSSKPPAGRASLDNAQGEFSSSKPTSPVDGPSKPIPEEPVAAPESESAAADKGTNDEKEKKGKWCVIM